MPTALLELSQYRIVAGLPTDVKPQIFIDYPEGIWPSNLASLSDHEKGVLGTRIHEILLQVFDRLLVSVTKCHIIIVEPVLCPLSIKKILALVLLSEFRAASLGFLPYSVCCCVGSGVTNGLVYTKQDTEILLVPVYDLKELTTLIQATQFPFSTMEEHDDDARPLSVIITKLTKMLNIDLRKAILNSYVVDDTLQLPDIPHRSSLGAWIGAAIICRESSIQHGLSRGKYLNDGKDIYDSLFDEW